MREDRRDFLKKGGLLTVAMSVGIGSISTSRALLAQDTPLATEPLMTEGKSKDLILLNNSPLSLETPPFLLDNDITPKELLFVKNNGIPPSNIDGKKWTLTVGGKSNKYSKGRSSESTKRTLSFTIEELKKRFSSHSYLVTLECAANGRKGFTPSTEGEQWDRGGVGCVKWTGARLKDILEYVGINNDAQYVVYYGADTTGDSKNEQISKAIPIKKAMENETLLAWAMNDEDIPLANGYPLRLVVGGWSASYSGKWIERITVRSRVPESQKVISPACKIPCTASKQGEKVGDEWCVVESMQVKSLITYPKDDIKAERNKNIEIRGFAWAGDRAIKELFLSTDFGATWKKCELEEPQNRYAWQRFRGSVSFSKKGYYEVWARAVDSAGVSQPMVTPGWNPNGLMNNSCHKIGIRVG